MPYWKRRKNSHGIKRREGAGGGGVHYTPNPSGPCQVCNNKQSVRSARCKCPVCKANYKYEVCASYLPGWDSQRCPRHLCTECMERIGFKTQDCISCSNVSETKKSITFVFCDRCHKDHCFCNTCLNNWTSYLGWGNEGYLSGEETSNDWVDSKKGDELDEYESFSEAAESGKSGPMTEDFGLPAGPRARINSQGLCEVKLGRSWIPAPKQQGCVARFREIEHWKMKKKTRLGRSLHSPGKPLKCAARTYPPIENFSDPGAGEKGVTPVRRRYCDDVKEVLNFYYITCNPPTIHKNREFFERWAERTDRVAAEMKGLGEGASQKRDSFETELCVAIKEEPPIISPSNPCNSDYQYRQLTEHLGRRWEGYTQIEAAPWQRSILNIAAVIIVSQQPATGQVARHKQPATATGQVDRHNQLATGVAVIPTNDQLKGNMWNTTLFYPNPTPGSSNDRETAAEYKRKEQERQHGRHQGPALNPPEQAEYKRTPEADHMMRRRGR